MEIFGSGGFVLLVVAILWLGFMTPSGQRREVETKTKRVRADRTQRNQRTATETTSTAQPLINKGLQAEVETVSQPEKVVINRLPDPLSARLGTIENVAWAQVHDLEKVRTEKENISSENLDEILQRRRSNG